MSFFGLLLLGELLARPASGLTPPVPHLPPPEPRAEPHARGRAPLDERRPLELLGHGRAWAPVTTPGGASSNSAALGAGAGVGFRTSPYFSVGAEGSVLRTAEPTVSRSSSFELAAVGRVYLLEAGLVDPYLELALGYSLGRARGASTELLHGPSARAGGGLDLVVLSPLRLGVLVSYREVVYRPDAPCSLGCRVRALGGLLAGVTVTLPLGEPL